MIVKHLIRNFFKSFHSKPNEWKEEIKQLESYFKLSTVKEFVDNYSTLITQNKSEQYFTYFGINFKNEKIDTIKFYAHTFDVLEEKDILKFIPKTEDYVTHLADKNTNNGLSMTNAGVALELKFKFGSEMPITGFFYHLNKNSDTLNAFPIPSSLPESFHPHCVALGINYEYATNAQKFKTYHYFKTDSLLDELKKLDVLPLLQEIKYIECGNASESLKINAYFTSIPKVWERINLFSSKEAKLIHYLNKRYSLTTMGYGKYSDHSIKSVYFRDAKVSVKDTSNKVQTIKSLLTK